MAKIIFVGNYKGGVGKTTTVINFANFFAERQKRVLTIDLDPQSSLSEIQVGSIGKSLSELNDDECLNFVFELWINKIKKYPSMSLLFDNEKLIKRARNGYDFIPSSLFYNGGLGLDSIVEMMENTVEYLAILKIFIDTIQENYDYIIIDCPPSNNIITRSAFLMSDYYLIPTICDKLSTNGVIHYIRTVKTLYKKICEEGEDKLLAKHYFGNEPVLVGIFFNLIKYPTRYDDVKAELIKYLKKEDISTDLLLNTSISNHKDIATTTANGNTSWNDKKDFDSIFTQISGRIK